MAISSYISKAPELRAKRPEEIRAFILTTQHGIRQQGRAFAEWYYQGDFWLEELDELALIPVEHEKQRDLKKERIVGLIDGWLYDYYAAQLYIEKKRKQRDRERGTL